MERDENSGSGHGNYMCSFIPPYLLKAIADSSEAPRSASEAEDIDNDIRSGRQVLPEEATPGFIPPYVTEALVDAEATEPQARESAQQNLQQDREIRRERAKTADLAVLSPTRQIYDCRETASLPGSLVRPENGPELKDRAVNNAYNGLGIAFNFFATVFGRNSIDNASLTLVCSMHYSHDYNNALWNGRQMIFGDGDGKYFDYFSDSLDVIVHELTHGVTQYTAKLKYENQPGALNESISDVFACMAEQWHFGQTSAQGDWILGQNILPVARKGAALRSLKAPGTAYNDNLGKDPQISHMRDYVTTDKDNGGVHYNSGIPNHAFYLTAIGLGGHSWERAGQIWYKSLTDRRVNPKSTFKEFAEVTLDHAQNMFGNLVSPIVKSSWQSVGVL
ncbi:hypothetical protein N7471_001700 [Penicillium samsonianum]|uniref:uncharacterized protein n=1 Tax=Penicillium samsonianum TaxID=1882272 RepID=UPI002548089F|nr:uncharacterized protein N7471_001700 [Penicillium samsonianum]KAJ6150501.1 hypothetical protein N7471_001700 [Penicillium samsonianum]